MAAASSSLGTQFHEELSCSICLELFTRPKVLPCQHTFCQDCLQDHAGRGGTFQCPNCRLQVRLPPQGVAGLPDNHLIASLCERLENQATLSEETRQQPQSGNRCSFHPTEVYRMYCKQCQMPVCEECIEGVHNNHLMTTIKKAAQENRSTVQALIHEGRNILEGYCGFIRGLRETEKNLNEQKDQRDNAIIQAYNQTVQTTTQKLTERKDILLSESQQNHSQDFDKIKTERDRMLADINELSAACDRAEQELQQRGVEFLITQQSALTGTVEKYRGKVAPTPVQTQPAVFHPTETPVPVLGYVTVPEPVSSAPFAAAPANRSSDHHSDYGIQWQSAQSLPSPLIPLPRTIQSTLFGHVETGSTGFESLSQQLQRNIYRGKAAPTPVQTQPAVFHPTDTPVPVLGYVTVPSAPIPATPAARGRGHHHGSLQSAPPPRTKRPPPSSNVVPRGAGHHHGDQSVQFLQSFFTSPLTHSACYSHATMGIGQHHDYHMYSQPQKVTFRISETLIAGQPQPSCPVGVTVSDEGEIFVADSLNYKIRVFNQQGNFQRQFLLCEYGGQKLCPNDVALDREGNLWVVGRTLTNDGFAMQYDKQGRVLRKFDLQKTEQYGGVAVDTRRNHILIIAIKRINPSHYYSSQQLQGEVLVFRPDGTLVRTVGQQQGMEYPWYITVDGEGNILVSDWNNNCVYVYNEDGQFLFQFGGEGSGEGQLKHPCGICTDRAGNIIVADRGNSRVEMFDKTGKFLKHITTDMKMPQAVAMATQGQLIVTDSDNSDSISTVTIFQNI
ncbi:uncharacterized protein LOC144903651 [Branchiostoma floridae x Branchiostoma belcheri]